jgi:hypothetical protein
MTLVRRLLLVFLLSLSFFAQAAAPLVDPDPVAVPAGLDAAAVAKEIKRSLVGRTWTVSAERPGEIEATLNLRKHVARVKIAYDTKEVRLSYVSSENLDYQEKNGERQIHKNYLSWVNNVLTDLSRNLQLAVLD